MAKISQVGEARGELEPGEVLLWEGRPPTGLLLRAADALLIPFSLLWGGFAIFWEVTAIAMAFGIASSDAHGAAATMRFAPMLLPLFGVPFVLFGVYLIAGRFFADARARERTSYALTNRRIIICSGLFDREAKSLQLRGLNDITLIEHGDGVGSIRLGPSAGLYQLYAGVPWIPGTKTRLAPTLERIPEAREVHRKLLEAQRADAR